MTTRLHASCVAIDDAGVVIAGPSGAGKSDLALRLIDQPGLGIGGHEMQATLVGDDQIVLSAINGQLMAAPAPGLEGLLEVRGLGIVKLGHATNVPVKLMVHLTEENQIERMPEPDALIGQFEGINVAQIYLDASSASAPARVRCTLCAIIGNGLLKN